MKDLIATYLFLPLVYILYKAGELADEKGRNPVVWRILAFLAAFTSGLLAAGLTGLIIYIANEEVEVITLVICTATAFILFPLIAGLSLFSRLNKRRPGSRPKRTYLPYDLKKAFLFPRVLSRSGILWRLAVYTIALYLTMALITLTATLLLNLFVTLSTAAFIVTLLVYLYMAAALLCFGMLYYISYICIPRIRDAGLSRDTLIALFIPGFSLIALIYILTTPGNRSRKSAI